MEIPMPEIFMKAGNI